MNFEWDDAKRLTNISKHGLDFEGIEEVFEGWTVTVLDDRFDYGEQRFVTYGLLGEYVVAVTHLLTDFRIRIISVRRASNYEKENYYKEIAN
ncbi:MAG: BrnT family toxin [Pyrinomonadaceae bacterium]|nr:BrnT family toxin [Pyrinomonadaceae bacterium]